MPYWFGSRNPTKKMARERWIRPVRLPILNKVGVGGLEPPTSASQTRRAGRLRYTPADKSIIRSMEKRQEPTILAFIRIILLAVSLILLFTACRPTEIPVRTPTASPTNTNVIEQLESTPIMTSTPELSIHEPSLTPTENCLDSGGELQTGQVYSDQLDAELDYLIYLPPCYQALPQKPYPAAYLLHGLSYSDEQWPRLGLVETMDALIASGRIQPFIIVLPEEVKPMPPQTSAFPEALIQDLIPWIDSHYNTLPAGEHRAIGGLSRGAAWAVHIGFENVRNFCCIGAHSLALFEADQAKIPGWLNQAKAEELPRVFVDIGRNDREWKSAENFTRLLDQFTIPHEWYLFDGDHDEIYWSDHLEQYLIWYAENW